MEPFETFKHAGVTVELHQDYDAGNPFETFDQAAELVLFDDSSANRNYDLKPADTLDRDRFVSLEHAHRYLTLMRRYHVALPFRIDDYGSSGARARLVTMDDDTDTFYRVDGFVAVGPRGVEVTGCTDFEEAARQDFATFASWVAGEVCGFVVAPGTREQDSCWGFYDEDHKLTHLRSEAKSAAEAVAETWREQWAESFAECYA